MKCWGNFSVHHYAVCSKHEDLKMYAHKVQRLREEPSLTIFSLAEAKQPFVQRTRLFYEGTDFSYLVDESHGDCRPLGQWTERLRST